MAPKQCLYYITFQCNDSCEFCGIWNDDELQKMEDTPVKGHIENLKAARMLGIKKMQVTGGEPMLYEELPEFLKAAKDMGFETNISTNGIRYQERAKEIKGLAKRIRFALDHPVKDEHDRSRGTECFTIVIKSIKFAKELNEQATIKYNITRDSIRFLPEMIEIAERLGVRVEFNPVYDYRGLCGFEKESIDHMKYYFKRKSVIADLSMFEFIRNRGNNITFPRCRARETTVTFLPNADRAIPCLFNQGGKQGREHICISCASWPYMLPSFSIGLDKYRFLLEYSKFREKHKEEIK